MTLVEEIGRVLLTTNFARAEIPGLLKRSRMYILRLETRLAEQEVALNTATKAKAERKARAAARVSPAAVRADANRPWDEPAL